MRAFDAEADDDAVRFVQAITEEQRRWRLILGERAEDLSPETSGGGTSWLSGRDQMIDRCLAMVYGGNAPFWSGEAGRRTGSRAGTRGASELSIPDWLDELRRSFPKQTAMVVQDDATKRPGFERLLTDPECMARVEPNVQMVARLLGLKNLVPGKAKEMAREMVRRVVRQVEEQVRQQIERALCGPPDPVKRVRHGPISVLDWRRTVKSNLKHFRPELGTVVPERVYFKERRSRQRNAAAWEIIILVDQSGSMGESLVYSCITASVLASLSALSTRLFLFDTRVVDMSPHLKDPVDVLFGATLGGGTVICDAVLHAASHVRDPKRTLVALITDLEENGSPEPLFRELAALKHRGVKVVTLLGMTTGSVPVYNQANAQRLVSMGIPAFCATPARFADLIARVLRDETLDAAAEVRP